MQLYILLLSKEIFYRIKYPAGHAPQCVGLALYVPAGHLDKISPIDETTPDSTTILHY